jgi:hypothetical protein
LGAEPGEYLPGGKGIIAGEEPSPTQTIKTVAQVLHLGGTKWPIGRLGAVNIRWVKIEECARRIPKIDHILPISGLDGDAPQALSETAD